MRICPKCGAVVGEDSNDCDLCGADLWESKSETIQEAVGEEEAAATATANKLERRELAADRWNLAARLTFSIACSGLIVLGFLLFRDSQQVPIGMILLIVGFIMLLGSLSIGRPFMRGGVGRY